MYPCVSKMSVVSTLMVAVALMALGTLALAQTPPAAPPAVAPVVAPAPASPAAAVSAPAAAAAPVTPAPSAAPVSAGAPSGPIFSAPAETASTAPAALVKGSLTGNNVNIRSGPGTDCPIFWTAPVGTEVGIIGRKGEWLEVEFPAKDFSWIAREFVEETPGSDAIAVKGNNVNVRSGPGTQFDRLYSVPAGFKMQVMERQPSWYKVMPAPEATAWIMAEFVSYAGSVSGDTASIPEVAGDVLPGGTGATGETVPATEAADAASYPEKLRVAEETFKSETAKENPAEWDLAKLEEAYNDIAVKSTDPVIRTQARTRLVQLKAYGAVKERALKVGKVDADLQTRIDELEKQRADKLNSIQMPVPTPFVATGTIEKFYMTGMGGATHKLVSGKSILYLLKSDIVDLSQYEGKHVGVQGNIATKPGYNVRFIEVTVVEDAKAAAK